MKLHCTILAVTLAVLAGNAAAQPHTPAFNGLLPVPANRIVGLWAPTVTVGPCQGGPTQTLVNFSTFHAGGTLSENNASPPTTRGPAQGVWQYLGRGQYKTRFQFFGFLPDGTFDGVRDIRTTTVLNAHATQYTATVYARILNPDGTLRVALCGSAVGERVAID